MASKEIIDRLACAKYIFLHGVEILESTLPYSEGLAVLAFHNAAEMMLRAIAEDIHVSTARHSHFHKILDSIDKSGAAKLSHRSALNQLNQSRNSFKHHGLLPQQGDARKFRHDLEGFFPNALHTFLGISYESLSLTGLIQHRRTSNWTKQAEASLNADKYADSIEASAKAFAIFMQYYRDPVHRKSRNRLSFEPGDVVGELYDDLSKVDEKVDLLASGIVHDEYRRFVSLTPSIQIASAGNLYVSSNFSYSPSYEDALFCSSFVIRTALNLQTHYRDNKFKQVPLTRQFRVVKAAPVIVYPVDDKHKEEWPQEDIWTPEVGEELVGYYEVYDHPGYIAILQDGDCAYIAEKAVERIDKK